MLKIYLKNTFRKLIRDKGNTFINIAGLALGITGCIIIFLILRDGARYDKHHANYDRIYRVVSQSKENGRDTYTQGIPRALPESFEQDFHEVEAVAFTSYWRNALVAVEQPDQTFKKYEEPTGVVITEPSFFQIFDRKILIGDSGKALDDPGEAIISNKWARRYFGTPENAIEKTVVYEDNSYSIKAVMEDHPSTTDLPFELMLSYATVKTSFEAGGWGSVSDQDNCYFLLKENESIERVKARIPDFVKKYVGADEDNPGTYVIQPLSTLHTDKRFGNYNKKMPAEARIAFTVIGVFLLLMACINFINLTTAEAMRRTREVGIRKVLGSSIPQLIIGFTGETFMITTMAVLVSLALTEACLGSVNSFLDLSLRLNLSGDVSIWVFLAGLTVTVSLISGLYPAFVMSKFKPALVMKGQPGTKSNSGFNLRRGLVIMQFFISQLFIIGTIVVVQQMEFMDNQDLGFAKDAIITVPLPAEGEVTAVSKMRSLKNEILRLKDVGGATLNYSPPASAGVLSTGFNLPDKGEDLSAQVKQVDGDYLQLFNIKLIAGDYLPDLDSMTGFVVNETLVQTAGYASNDDIIGKELDFWGKRLPVLGVVKDFNTRSLSKPMEPVVLLNGANGYKNLSIKLNPSNLQTSVVEIRRLWETAYPEHIFKYEFLDEQIGSLYRGERKMSKLIGVFSLVAVFIGCLGLFGLISFIANQKTREVGIRKVLGASVENILLGFTKELARLILLGFLVAGPLGWFIMSKYLQEFAYRIDLGPMIFVIALSITFVIALATVGFRAIRAATANPVTSLRTE